jgi:hypothetical protein
LTRSGRSTRIYSSSWIVNAPTGVPLFDSTQVICVIQEEDEETMSRFVTMLIAGVFVAGNAVAQTTTAPAAPAKSPASATAATPATPATPAAPAAAATPAKPATGSAAAQAKKADAKADAKAPKADAKKATPETGKK